MGVVLLSFEVEDRVDHVLEHFRSGETAVLRHMSHENRRQVAAFRGEEQVGCGLADLRDAAGRRRNLQRKHRLNRVHDEQRRLHAVDSLDETFETGFSEQIQRAGVHTQAIAAHLDLVFGFLARAIENGPVVLAKCDAA